MCKSQLRSRIPCSLRWPFAQPPNNLASAAGACVHVIWPSHETHTGRAACAPSPPFGSRLRLTPTPVSGQQSRRINRRRSQPGSAHDDNQAPPNRFYHRLKARVGARPWQWFEVSVFWTLQAYATLRSLPLGVRTDLWLESGRGSSGARRCQHGKSTLTLSKFVDDVEGSKASLSMSLSVSWLED